MRRSQRVIPHSRPSLGADEADALSALLRGGFVGPGPASAELETRFAALHGREHAVAVLTGTMALELALRASGAGPGGFVLVPALVCSAVPQAVFNTGAEAVPVDLDPDSLAMAPAACERLVAQMCRANARVDAIVAVHPFGQACEVGSLLSLGPAVIEDCAGSLGCAIEERVVGSLAPMAVFSLGSTKMITAGAGGILVMSDAQAAQRVAALLAYEASTPFVAGFRTNGRLSDVNAALGLVQLRRLPEFIQARTAVADAYDRGLAELPGVRLPARAKHVAPSWHRYIVRSTHAKSIADKLGEAGIRASHQLAAWVPAPASCPFASCPDAASLRQTLLSLPIYPELGADQDRVLASVRSIAAAVAS